MASHADERWLSSRQPTQSGIFNVFWGGIFHASTYIFVATGLIILWRVARKRHIHWSGKLLPGSMLIGFGVFNLVEGVINHHLLGLHHVNETVPRDQWVYWDIGFLVWGALMLAGGWLLLRQGQEDNRRRIEAESRGLAR
jgi:uncharacterized membrane protein